MSFVGRLSGKHLVIEGGNVELDMKERCLQFAAAMDLKVHCFVYEEGAINEEPHVHFFFETLKSADTVRRNLIKHFKLPPKAYSLKAADTEKLPTYFVYLAKVRTV